ncbi:hypothetical protein Q9314_24775 (plasmid) [Shinella sumterensis]|nr:hypothetical protein Q9314_24775 [Shinella sumterensis]
MKKGAFLKGEFRKAAAPVGDSNLLKSLSAGLSTGTALFGIWRKGGELCLMIKISKFYQPNANGDGVPSCRRLA